MIGDPNIDRYFEVFIARRKVPLKSSTTQQNQDRVSSAQQNSGGSSGSEEAKSELSQDAESELNFFPQEQPEMEDDDSDVGSETESVESGGQRSMSIASDAMTEAEKDDLNNGALVVHSVAKGRPNLDKFMARL
mmetsp:Transcript_19095/g.25867  ORF Transcript_19095/g.25867 Transcript_19095/m.25867 type:complete len:134 (-) Transcript_19095:594-995(-)